MQRSQTATNNQGHIINIQQLNTEFGIANQVTFIETKGGLIFIKINNKKANALISLYAGQVLSFKPVDEDEDFLFNSESAFYQEGKAIKGGIPICWPWFGADPADPELPNHGFVRNNYWSVSSVTSLENGDTSVRLEFRDTEKSRKIWPHSFYLSLDICISNTLNLELFTRNTGDQAFSITEALHTYFNVGDSAQVRVLGLEHTEYLDKTEGFVKVCQVGAITLTEETDHIHSDIKHDLIIDDPMFNRKIRISSSGNKNVVIWNPWKKGSAKIKDLHSDDYKHFVCVEIANAASDIVEIPPKGEYKMLTNYSILKSQQ